MAKGIINVLFNGEKKQNSEEDYFILDSIDAAQSLIKLQGVKFMEREVGFSVVSVQQFLLDPITKDQLAYRRENKKWVLKEKLKIEKE